jgi:hypothetical protein
MRRSRFWAAGLAVLVMLGFPAPVSAGGGVFVIANTASGLGEPVPRGALLSVFVDQPVSPEDGTFDPWVTVGPGGFYITGSCRDPISVMLPITTIKNWGSGQRIDVYYPNGLGDEPFGLCDDEGISDIYVQPAIGMGQGMRQPVVTVNGHPGIFSVGVFPDGEHLNGSSAKTTSLTDCARDPVFCPVRTSGVPAELTVRLTGAEFFRCKPCFGSPISFELAQVTNGVVGPYQPQTLLSLATIAMGVEEANFRLSSNLTGGEYRLRVTLPVQPNMPEPLTVLLGPAD